MQVEDGIIERYKLMSDDGEGWIMSSFSFSHNMRTGKQKDVLDTVSH